MANQKYGSLLRLPKPRLFVPRKVRNIAVSAFILVILLSGAGILYVKVSDGNDASGPAASSLPKTTVNAIQPAKPSPKAPEGVMIDMLSSPVSRGTQASMSITTNAGSACKIVVAYNKIPTTDPGLKPQTADAYGSVEWTWTVAKTAPLGAGTATVTCVYHGRTGVVIGNVQIAK